MLTDVLTRLPVWSVRRAKETRQEAAVIQTRAGPGRGEAVRKGRTQDTLSQ